MKFKVRVFGDDFDKDGKSLLVGINFPNKKIEYKYNEFKKCLEEVGEIDLFEQIQSVEYTKLDMILNRFLETGEASILNQPHKINAFVKKQEMLSQMSEMIDELEQVKRDNNMSADVSLEDVAKQILGSKDMLDKYIKEKLQEFESTNSNNINKETLKNEKENFEEKE